MNIVKVNKLELHRGLRNLLCLSECPRLSERRAPAPSGLYARLLI